MIYDRYCVAWCIYYKQYERDFGAFFLWTYLFIICYFNHLPSVLASCSVHLCEPHAICWVVWLSWSRKYDHGAGRECWKYKKIQSLRREHNQGNWKNKDDKRRKKPLDGRKETTKGSGFQFITLFGVYSLSFKIWMIIAYEYLLFSKRS